MQNKVMDYDSFATTYDEVRNIEPLVYSTLCALLNPAREKKVLDFGCGTGNYLKRFSDDYHVDPYGIEPSERMRAIAQRKIPQGRIEYGDHLYIPFASVRFDSIYITDVIHHITDLTPLFSNLAGRATNNGKLCICTESSAQLSEKYWLNYFPSILHHDHKRFHPIDNVIAMGKQNGWAHERTVTLEEESCAAIGENFMLRVQQKALSVLHLIPESEYQMGLSKMTADYKEHRLIEQLEGYTFLLFRREENNEI